MALRQIRASSGGRLRTWDSSGIGSSPRIFSAHLGDRAAREGGPPGQHLVERHPQAPDVGAGVDVAVPVELLRGHVGGVPAPPWVRASGVSRAAFAVRIARRAIPLRTRARPKSITQQCSASSIMMFDGFTSRWITWASWAYWRASAAVAITEATDLRYLRERFVATGPGRARGVPRRPAWRRSIRAGDRSRSC